MILTPFLASSLVFLLPFLVGCGGIAAWHAFRNHRLTVSDLLLAPAIGSLMIFGLTVLSYFPFSWLNQSAVWGKAFPLAIWGIALLSFLGIVVPFRQKSLLVFRKHLLTSVPLILGSALLSFAIWSWRSPMPLNWDMYEHQTLVNNMVSGRFSIFTSQISDTFGFSSYPPYFHSLLWSAQSQLIKTPAEIASFWNWTGLWQAIGVGLASYAFAYSISRRRLTAAFAAVLSTLIFDSTIAFTNLFLLPQNLTAIMAVLGLAKLNYDWQIKRHTSIVLLLLTVISLGLSHFVIGSLAIALLLFTWFCVRFWEEIFALTSKIPLVETALLGSVALNLGAGSVNLSFLNNGEGADYIFNASTVSQFLFKAYGNAWLFFLPLAIKKYIQKRNYLFDLHFFLLLEFAILLCAPLPYMFKFFVLGRFWLIFWLAVGLAVLFDHLKTTLFRAIAFGIVIIGLVGLLMANVITWKAQLATDTTWSHFSQDELKVAEFLQTQHPNDFLISDPATQYILEGLSGVNSPGGAFEPAAKRDILANAINSNDPELLATQLQQIDDDTKPAGHRLFVLSGRTWRWVAMDPASRNSFSVNVWSPVKMPWLAGLYAQKLIDSPRFELIYQTPSILVFSLE